MILAVSDVRNCTRYRARAMLADGFQATALVPRRQDRGRAYSTSRFRRRDDAARDDGRGTTAP